MRKLLQNKLVVSALAGIAVLSVAGNFVKLPGRFSSAAAREPEVNAAEAAPVSMIVPGETEFSRTLRAWHELYPINPSARDPFVPGIEPTAQRTGTVTIATNPSLAPSFILHAVSIEAHRHWAVINRTVVTEGELINGYRVEKILTASVTLNGDVGSFSIDMNRPSQRQKVPTANVPAADLPPAPAGQKSATAKR